MTTIYIITDGDISWSTCVSVHLTKEEAEKAIVEYSRKYTECNATITEKQIKL